MQAGAVVAEIAGVDDVLDDLAERQRDDGEIVARKAQDRHADDDAEQPGRRAARQESQRQRGKHGQAVAQQGPYQHPGKSPYAHEPGVPQAQLAQKADGQIQRDRHHHIGADRDQLPFKRVGQQPQGRQQLHGQIKHDDDAERDKVAPGRLADVFETCQSHGAHLTLSR